jgi:predicted DNA-binding protein
MIAISLPPIEETLFRQIAKKQGVRPAALAKRIVMDKIEEEEDAADIALAEARLAKLEAGESHTRSFEEVFRELGF